MPHFQPSAIKRFPDEIFKVGSQFFKDNGSLTPFQITQEADGWYWIWALQSGFCLQGQRADVGVIRWLSYKVQVFFIFKKFNLCCNYIKSFSFFWGADQVILRGCCWICTQESFLVANCMQGKHMQCSPLYYCSSSLNKLLYLPSLPAHGTDFQFGMV